MGTRNCGKPPLDQVYTQRLLGQGKDHRGRHNVPGGSRLRKASKDLKINTFHGERRRWHELESTEGGVQALISQFLQQK